MIRPLTAIRIAGQALILGFAAVTCGCMQVDTVITVNKDGSGTIVQEAFLNPNMLQLMMDEMDGEQFDGDITDMMDIDMNPAPYRKKAAAMGKDVKFVHINKVVKLGRQGISAQFSFADIRTVHLQHVPDILGGPLAEFNADVKGKAGDNKNEDIKFDFRNKPAPKLIIKIPQTFDGDLIEAELGGPEPDEIPMDEMGMMKQMFEGSRFRLIIKVDGKIKFTNASHFLKEQKKGERDQIILMEMDVGRMVTDPEHHKAVSRLKELKDAEQMKKALEKLPGLRYELEEFIEINY